MMGMCANGPVFKKVTEVYESGETILPVLMDTFKLGRASVFMRFIVDLLIKNTHPRKAKMLNSLRRLSEKDYE